MSDNIPALLAFDWGTSALRAYRLSADGSVLDRRARPWGIQHLPEGGFVGAFEAITDGWRDRALPAIACGMVGSQKGWHQVDYLSLPLDLDQLAGGLATVDCPGGVLHLVPGLLDPTRPDVMRGEETEAVGALEALGHPDGDLLLVMPGTHCKWVRVSGGVIAGFSTYMTGELYALLSRHSILGGTPADETLPATLRDQAFADGVVAARDGLTGRLFSTRALMLTGRLDPGLVPYYLSGLLIGDELSQALAHHHDQVVLVGDHALTRRYALAFETIGRPAPRSLDAASVRGLYRIAVAAGLVPGATAC